MNNKDVESRLRRAVEQSVPDVRESILSRCDEREGKVVVMKAMNSKKNSSWKKYVAVAAMAALVCGGAGMYVQGNSVDSTIELAVNPSVELSVNKKERVVDVEALNNDAKVVLDDMDLEGTDLDVAVNALIGSMLKHGYISELQNSILISVDNDDTVRGKELEERLVKEVNELLAASSIEGAILSQQISHDDDAKQLAKELEISEGKAALIGKITEKDDLLKKEELKKLDINELNLLMESKKLELNNASSTGKASDKAYIGMEKAKGIAFGNAGVKESEIRDLEVELDVEDGIMIYEVQFDTKSLEYEYDIHAVTGEILHLDKETNDDWYDDDDWDDGWDDDDRIAAASQLISRDKAKSIALNHAGVKESEVRFTKLELDEDDGIWEYDIEFEKGNLEYEYEINAKSGVIIEAEKDYDDDDDDWDDDWDDDDDDDDDDDVVPVSSDSGRISAEKAKSIALGHAGLKASEVRFTKVELDEDDGIWEYDIEFEKGNMEYEYEINAKSGVIIEAEKDYDDDDDDDDDWDDD